MTGGRRHVSRRIFLAQAGRATVGLALVGFGAAACAGADAPGDADAPGGDAGAPGTGAPATDVATGDTPAGSPAPATPGGVRWHRVDLGFVSAYVLARDGEAAVVDTGVDGSAGDIEAVLTAAGLGWDAVGHVLLTHKHPDHVGSLDAVLAAASEAAAYAGAGDIPAISSPRPLVAVGDGDEVFGLQVIETPGHTPGHVSVLDPVAGLLVAGDALNGQDGGVVGANPQFSEDMTVANESVRKLAALSFETVVFGHGEPVEGGADAQVRALAEGL